MKYTGHVLSNSSGLSHLQALESCAEGKIEVSGRKRTQMKDLLEWIGLNTYERPIEQQRRKRDGNL